MLGAVQPTAQQRPSPAKRRGGSAASSAAPGGGGGGAATRLRASLRRRSRPVRGLIFSAGAAAGFSAFELAAGENEGDSNKPIMGIVVPSLAFEFHGVQARADVSKIAKIELKIMLFRCKKWIFDVFQASRELK